MSSLPDGRVRWYRTWRVPALLFAIAVAVKAWLIIGAAQEAIPFDGAFQFLLTFSSFGGAVVLSLIWFMWLGTASRKLKTRLAIGLVAALALFFTFFRIEILGGDLGFRAVPRFAKTADQQLAVAKNASLLTTKTVEPSLSTVPALPGLGNYLGFLGNDRSGSISGIKLARDWEKQPPRKLWRQKIGAGWSSFAVSGNIAVTQEQRGEEELVTAYDVASGELLWSHADKARYESVLGKIGPRATPQIQGDRLYALGALGHLNCLELATGKVIWSRNVLTDVGSTPEDEIKLVAWGRSASPLIVDRKLIVPGGGPSADGPLVSLLAYDIESGKPIGRGGEHQISYSSPSLTTLGGTRQIVIVNEACIAGHDAETLKQLWEIEWLGGSSSSASVPQTFPIGDDKIFVTKGYSGGAMLFQVLKDEAGAFSTQVLWRTPSSLKTKFTNPVLKDGYAYGLSDGILECISIDKGKRKWKEGRYGHGQVLLVEDLLLIQAESGEVVLVEAVPEKFHELTRFPAIEGMTWNNPCLAGRYLLVRNSEEAACYELPLAE